MKTEIKFYRQKINYFGANNPNYRGGLIESICLFCGQLVKLYPGTYRKKLESGEKTFCSHECHNKYRIKPKPKKRSMIGRGHPRWSGEKFCAICQIELVGRDARRKKTCENQACIKKLRSTSKMGLNNGRYQDVKIFCKQCAKEITHHHRLLVTFCSRKCSAKWQSENLSGKNSHLYRGGTSPYVKDWKMIRKAILLRDNYICQTCRISKIKHLAVHHIDRNKQNNKPENLITLCNNCHKRLHWNRFDLILNYKLT